ncbi:hypothetical protein [Streptomyces sp. NBC_00198]|uniref:hypothetical protein n=1 Tax=Streptomyces sp. NBC_00198 TaxID=2975677 RepID=UPI00225810E4|nr:hypothetical protein [Streptomyces sp. NBC_00198]MCX5285675.1 hypothetical protein [Streptomyces sp. NBC_00198]MCX5286223.1 hypothetical protein [Streptomyces sp. NBC_00198]
MTAPETHGEQPTRRNRQQRRDRQKALIKHLLDGPPRRPVCGQAKAAARARTAGPAQPKTPKGDPSVKARARELQASTGQPYGVCLAEVRALEQQARNSEGES